MKPGLYPSAVLTFEGLPALRVLWRRAQPASSSEAASLADSPPAWWTLENLDPEAPRHESYSEEHLMARLHSGELRIQALERPLATAERCCRAALSSFDEHSALSAGLQILEDALS